MKNEDNKNFLRKSSENRKCEDTKTNYQNRRDELAVKNEKYSNSDKNKRIGGESKLVVKKGYKVLACSHALLSKPGSHGPPEPGQVGWGQIMPTSPDLQTFLRPYHETIFSLV